MTEMYEKLAGLLRQAVMVWPNTFQFSDAEDGIVIALPGIAETIHLVWLSDPRHFSQDHMDFIVSQIGMWFDIHHIGDGTWYGSGGTTTDDMIRCDSGFHPTKRTASVAATIACLEYALNARLERKGRE